MVEPNLWLPLRDRTALAALAKLIEECGELASAAARCIAQGPGEREPVTGKMNSEWLAEEMADVMALIQLVENIGVTGISGERIKQKYDMKLKWLKMIVAWEKTNEDPLPALP